MRILVVGGTGLIGGHAAVHLQGLGHAVTLAARKPPAAATPMAGMATLIGDYTSGEFPAERLAGFEAVLFAAGADFRHMPAGADADEFWNRTQIHGVPAFVAQAREAGVKRVVHIGSYYHQISPGLVGTHPYVRARYLADIEVRALATTEFNVCTLNPPSIVGVVPGLPSARYEALAAWARSVGVNRPAFAPPGGTNYMSVESLSEAIVGALAGAETGKAYLVGDQNLTFARYFQTVLDAVGNPARVRPLDEEHPLLPDFAIVQGRGNAIAYEPDRDELRMLGYRRNDAVRAIWDAIASVSPS